MVERVAPTALVTGAGTGIGRAIALRLAAAGHGLVLVGRRREMLAEVAAKIGGAVLLTADVATDSGRARVAAAIPERLKVLVHAAGAFLHAPLSEMRAADWETLDKVNLRAPVLLTSLCLPALHAGAGDVVFINSTVGLQAKAGVGAYAAGKYALRAIADVFRQELSNDGIRVLSIFPGRTDTPLQAAVLAAERRAMPQGTAPPGTFMHPDDVAAMVLAAILLPRRAEVTEIIVRPARPI